MIGARITDGVGEKNSARVDGNGRIHTLDHGIPAFGVSTEVRIFREFFVDSSDSNDMVVDGSVTNQDFIIEPPQNADRYISTISFVISDVGASLELFGALTALTNGVEIFYEDELGIVQIDDAIQDNFDFVRLCHGKPAFGDSTTAFLAPNISPPPGKADAYIPILDLKSVFGTTWGIRLSAGSTQKVVIRIKDALAGLEQFDAIAFGFDRLEGE